jgi:hypothetical protein
MKKFFIAIPVFILSLLIISMDVGGVVNAVTGSDWRAGRIIDDAMFTDKNAMSPTQIQQFLNSKMVGCDTHGTQLVSYVYNGQSVTTSRALHSYRRGNGAVTVVKPDNIPDSDHPWYTDNTWFRCLNDYWENPSTGQNNYANRPIPAGGKSAAQLIWEAGQNHNISPKVLLVTLQKEQSLITDTWPFQMQYLHALGAYCPDNPPPSWPNGCDPNHEGFSKQMNDGASLFRYYLDNMYQPWWSYKKPGNNSILFQANNNACGSSVVYIENMATAALYTYTPYQPNQAALSNLYGTGDICSAYGNRNFWRMFHDWFGTTYSDAYSAQFNAQSAYPAPMYAGQSRTVYIKYKNLGSARWYDDTSVPSGIAPVHLAATNPINRQSPFSYGWPSSGRPNVNFTRVYEANGSTLAGNQHVVEPGQIAQFEFNVTTPYELAPGVYREHFQPVLEGSSNWSMGAAAWLDITVVPSHQATYHSQSSHPTVTKNTTVSSYIQYKNTGFAPWYDNVSASGSIKPVNLATSGPINRGSGFSASWFLNNRPVYSFSKVFESDGTTLAANQHIVQPGQIAKFEFTITAPANLPSGTYREYFQPIVEGASNWAMGGVAWSDVTVAPRTGVAQFHNQSPYPTSPRGQSNPVFISYRNSTNFSWYDSSSKPVGILPIHLAATSPINRNSVFSWNWVSASRPNILFSKVFESDGTTLAANQHIVQPGQIAKFEFSLTTPWTINSGVHREHLQPLLEGASEWSLGGVGWLDISVTP